MDTHKRYRVAYAQGYPVGYKSCVGSVWPVYSPEGKWLFHTFVMLGIVLFSGLLAPSASSAADSIEIPPRLLAPLESRDKLIPAYSIRSGKIALYFGLTSEAKTYEVFDISQQSFDKLRHTKLRYGTSISVTGRASDAQLTFDSTSVSLGAVIDTGEVQLFPGTNGAVVSLTVAASKISGSKSKFQLIRLSGPQGTSAIAIVSSKTLEDVPGKDLYFTLLKQDTFSLSGKKLQIFQCAARSFQEVFRFKSKLTSAQMASSLSELSDSLATWSSNVRSSDSSSVRLVGMSERLIASTRSVVEQYVSKNLRIANFQAALTFLEDSYRDLFEVLLDRYDDDDPMVKIYSYRPGASKRHHVIFKYADLLNRAVQYKTDNPNAEIEIKFALYKIAPEIFVGVTPETMLNGKAVTHPNYGKVNGEDFEGAERLVYSMLKAGQKGIAVQFLYHNPDGEDEIAAYFKNKSWKNIRRAKWGGKSKDQMHNKFMTVRIVREGRPISHAVYVATSNGNEFNTNYAPLGSGARSETGVLVRDHSALYDAYSRYFDTLWENYDDVDKFRDDMNNLHSMELLNYHDDHFRAYFYPMPKENPFSTRIPGDDFSAAWAENYNPITYLVKKLNVYNGPRHVKIRSYWCGSPQASYNRSDNEWKNVDPFSLKFAWELKKLHMGQTTTSPLDIRSVINLRYRECAMSSFDSQISGSSEANTHEKNLQFAFGRQNEFYSLTGSTNLHTLEFTHKANNILMIEENSEARPVYQTFKDIFYSNGTSPEYYEPE